MALLAVLEFGDNSIQRYSKQYLVSDCRFVFDRNHNAFSPEGAARCNQIEVVVVAPGRNDLGLFQWFSNQESLDGRIVISLGGSKHGVDDTQVIFFENAKCFALSEMYDISSSRRRLLKLLIGSEKIEIDGVTFNRV